MCLFERPAQTSEPHTEKQHLSILIVTLMQAAPTNLPSSSHPKPPHSPYNLRPSSSETDSDLPQKLDCTCSSFFTIPPSSLLVSTLPASTSSVFPIFSIWFLFMLLLPFPARCSPFFQTSPPESTTMGDRWVCSSGLCPEKCEQGQGTSSDPTSREVTQPPRASLHLRLNNLTRIERSV